MPSWRRALRLWHRCFGIGVGLWLFLLALTGCAITFYEELDRWLNPDWRSVPAWVGPTRVDAALDQAQRALPGFAPKFIDLPDTPDRSLLLLGSIPQDGDERRTVQIFADPRDGRLLGTRTGDHLAFDRRHLMDTLYALHLDLMLGPAMTWFLGLVSLLWIIDHLAALPLAIPRLALWREALRVGGRRFNLRRLYDLHRAPALWLFPITLTLAITGLTLTWQDETRHAVSHLSPVSERLHYDFPDTAPPAGSGIDRLLAIVRTESGRTIDSIVPLADKGVHAFRAFDDRDLDGLGRLWLYVRITDGTIIARRHDNGSSAGDAFFAWQYPLHSGQAFGLAGRIAVLIGGLATIALCLSGWLLWLRRRKRTNPKMGGL